MDKITTLKTALVLIILFNFGLMAALFFGQRSARHHHHHHDRTHQADLFLKNEFGFSDEQMQIFITSRVKHQTAIKTAEGQLNSQTHLYYLQPADDTKSEELFHQIQQTTADIYKINKRHIEEVKAICNPDQLLLMDDFISELRGKKKHKKKRKRRNKCRK